jgi:DNA-binding transcriptional regulator YdaS (Cro superfamily)
MSQERVTKEQLVQHLKRCVKSAGTQRAFAEQVGISQQYVSDVLAGRRDPGPKLAAAIGFRSQETVFYRYRLTAD